MRSVCTRRLFLASLAAAVPVASGAEGPKRDPVVDTHLHCFAGGADPRFPYHPRAPYRPVDSASPEHLLRCMQGAGVDFAVVVHPEPYQDDHRYLEHCLQVGKGKLKGTALVFADRAGFEEKLKGLASRVPLTATRIHAYAPDRLPPFEKPELRRLWKTATDLGLAVQLHFEPRYAPGFEPLIRDFPSTTVLIDHLGRPFQGTPKEYEVVLAWARFKNTIIKLSSLPAAEEYPHRQIAPVIRRVADAYGAERMVYGGGYGASATGESYRAARERIAGFLSHLRPAEVAAILGGNAARMFRFGG